MNKSVLLITGKVLFKASMFLSSIIAIRLLTPENTGNLNFFKSIATTGSLVLLFGTSNELNRVLAERGFDNNYKTNLINSMINCLIILLFGSLFLAFLFKADLTKYLSPKIEDFSLVYLFVCLTGMISFLRQSESMLSGLNLFNQISIPYIFVSLLAPINTYILTEKMGLLGSLTSLVSVYFVLNTLLLKSIFSVDKIKFKLYLSLNHINNILKESKFIFSHEIIYSISNSIILTILMKTLSESNFGYFTVGEQLSQMVIYAPLSLLGYYMTKLVKNEKLIDKIKITNRYLIFCISLYLVSIIPFLINKSLISSILGHKYYPIEKYLLYFLLMSLPHILIGVFQQLFISLGKSKIILSFSFVSNSLMICGVIFGYYFQKSMFFFVGIKIIILYVIGLGYYLIYKKYVWNNRC